MITYTEFSKIDEYVKESVTEVFEFLKKKSMYYILFLANGEYKPDKFGSTVELNPYMIDSREDEYKDEARYKFLIEFMKLFYSFPNKTDVDDSEFRIHMELMVYTHIWESKPFLKQLFRIANLIDNKQYPWEVNIPENSKHEFIRFQIRDVLKKHQLKLAEVISNGFHTSLRNAFAHSEYYFNNFNKKIFLDTYKGKSWDIPEISYDDWAKRFAHSVLLSYHFYSTMHNTRKSLSVDYSTNQFVIILPKDINRFQAVYISYDSFYDKFYPVD